MTSWNEDLHARASNGRFAETAGSAPESSLGRPSAGQPNPYWGELPAVNISVRVRRREEAMRALWSSQSALTLLSAQEVAARVREEHPDAVGLQLTESDQDWVPTWCAESIVLADGSVCSISDDLFNDISTTVSDIRPDGDETWFTKESEQRASMSFDDVLTDIPPIAGAYVVDDRVPAPRTAADRAAHMMTQGWVDLPAEPAADPDETHSAVADAMSDLVHFADRYGLDVEAVFGHARDRAAEEVANPF